MRLPEADEHAANGTQCPAMTGVRAQKCSLLFAAAHKSRCGSRGKPSHDDVLVERFRSSNHIDWFKPFTNACHSGLATFGGVQE